MGGPAQWKGPPLLHLAYLGLLLGHQRLELAESGTLPSRASMAASLLPARCRAGDNLHLGPSSRPRRAEEASQLARVRYARDGCAVRGEPAGANTSWLGHVRLAAPVDVGRESGHSGSRVGRGEYVIECWSSGGHVLQTTRLSVIGRGGWREWGSRLPLRSA